MTVEGEVAMTTYRCHVLDGDRIAAVEVIDCADDASALIEADRILEASHYTTVEVWCRQHKVSILSRKSSAA